MDWIRRAPASVSNTSAKRCRRFPIAPSPHHPAQTAAAPSQHVYGPWRSLASQRAECFRPAGVSCFVDQATAAAATALRRNVQRRTAVNDPLANLRGKDPQRRGSGVRWLCQRPARRGLLFPRLAEGCPMIAARREAAERVGEPGERVAGELLADEIPDERREDRA